MQCLSILGKLIISTSAAILCLSGSSASTDIHIQAKIQNFKSERAGMSSVLALIGTLRSMVLVHFTHGRYSSESQWASVRASHRRL